MTRFHLGAWLVLASGLLSGCATHRDYEARGNFIVVARFDSRYADGGEPRVMSDNAGGIPSAAAGAAGVPMSPAGGAALDIGLAAVVNFLASEEMKGVIPIAFKILYEKDCKYDKVAVDLRKSPVSEKLYPGYIGRIAKDADGRAQILPVLTDAKSQAYLTKNHPCYPVWVTEWRTHQSVIQTNPRSWGTHHYFYGGKSVDDMPYPDLPWVK